MSLVFEIYDRNTFPVKAIRITKENIGELADLHNTYVQVKRTGDLTSEYFNIPVVANNRPKEYVSAYVGDWYTITETSAYRYGAKKFAATFTKRPTLEMSLEGLRDDLEKIIQPAVEDRESTSDTIDKIFRLFGIV